MGGLSFGIALMATFLIVHIYQLAQLGFAPQTNAYGSIFYVLSWAMDILVLIGLGLAGMTLVRAWLEVEHWQLFLALNVQMTAHYGYFTAAIAAVVYGTLYLSPYVI